MIYDKKCDLRYCYMIFLIIPSNIIAKAVKIADSVHNNLKPICDKKSEITPLAKRLANPKITGSNDKIVALIVIV
ncbi:hypothetical protein [Lactococcus lactis]|nr:hypothetical protein [Lactococcus lactis]MDT2904838.1 hypothetical protein [Lactococcus lactis]MDT2911346.1 hypothetical protein [Lactococcus lactis]